MAARARVFRFPARSARPAAFRAGGARRFAGDEGGQSLVFAVFTIFALVIASLMIVGVERTTTQKIKLQNAADAATLAAVLVEADALAQIAWINEAMASVYYDAMRACVDTATLAVHAELEDGAGLSTWTVPPEEVVSGGHASYAPPESLVVGGSRARWESVYSAASERVPRAEKWLRRLGQVERSIALLTPELMRHQMMYAARRNLAGDAATTAEIMDKVRVASYPDLNRTGRHESYESKTFTFISDEAATRHKALITKIGDPGEYPNGWSLDATETTGFRMHFTHNASDDAGGISDADSKDTAVRRFFEWDRRGAGGWHDTWSASVTQNDVTSAYEIKFHDSEKDDIRSINDPPSHDYLLRQTSDNGAAGVKLVRHRLVSNPAQSKFSRVERVDLYDFGSDGWTTVVNYTHAQSGNGAHGGKFDKDDLEICVWEGAGTTPSISGRPDHRVKVKASGTSSIWNEDKGQYEDPPASFQLSDINGVQVPLELADRFYLGGPEDGTVINWCLPMHLWFHGQRVVLTDPLDISYNTPIGCHGYVHFSADDRAARVHDLSTLAPDLEWSAPHNDRRRHRLYAVEDETDQWYYEWIDAGPACADMSGRRFGYHALMDRLHPGTDYTFPRPDENEEAGWRALLSNDPTWPTRPGNHNLRSSLPARPPAMPLYAQLPEPEDPEGDDADVADPTAEEPFGGWFDIATCRPAHVEMTTGPNMGLTDNPVAFSVTVPCWYCGDKGTYPGRPLRDVLATDATGAYTRGQSLGGGRVTGCGFWHETFEDSDDWTARVVRLNLAGADYLALSAGSVANPYTGVHFIQVTCPFRCTREWTDGSRPARLDGHGKYKGRAETEIPSHVRVTLKDAASLAWTHPSHSSRTVKDADGNTVTAADNRPRRARRALDYGYVHMDNSTYWTRDYFGVFRDNRQVRADDANRYDEPLISVPSREPDDGDITNFWDQVSPPLEVASVTGELFRTGLTVAVWTDIEDWMGKIWPSGAGPTRSADVAQGYKDDVAAAMARDEPRGAVHRDVPSGSSDAERDWRAGRVNPLEEAPWGGLFAFASGRVFYPAVSGDIEQPRHDFAWENTDENATDLLDQVVNPARDEWLDSPMNLHDPNWRAALVPLGAACDLRDLESGEMTGESDLQYFLRRRLTTSPFRSSVAASDQVTYERELNGDFAGPYRTLRWGLVAPPGQENLVETGRVEWYDRSRDDRGLEQVVAK